ncbi:hypothetical protein D3C74_358830 [compost metagenome]
MQNIQRVDAEGKLAVSAQAAADLVWASANTASWLYVTAQIRKTPPPQPDVVDLIRESVMQIILIQRANADSK